ncbi:MAG TPA: hypothetical protein P5052_03020 [Candidatus Paceibacterota bacterium]|nr:hypothetical protein [Candidatus Paceibacterota bacterium]
MAKEKINYDSKNEQDLKDYLEEHFCYEVEKLIISNNKLIETEIKEEKHIFLECLCLHARNIIEFLFFKEYKNYNRAVYYLNDED